MILFAKLLSLVGFYIVVFILAKKIYFKCRWQNKLNWRFGVNPLIEIRSLKKNLNIFEQNTISSSPAVTFKLKETLVQSRGFKNKLLNNWHTKHILNPVNVQLTLFI